ncbi:MAG: phage tail tip lysozyme [Kocuria sp.]|nr:phage tail tip lysozyme [Kocuria sp.]
MQGKNGGSGRRAAGRYAGAAASGAASGAKGGAPGAAAGAAKKVGTEGAKDAAKGAKKATGGSPVAKPAGQSGSDAGRGVSSAGGLSSRGSPTTGASGRGTKSLGGASASTSGQGGSAGSAGRNGSASKGSVGSPGTGSQQGSPGSQDASTQAGGRGAPTAQGGAGQPGSYEAAEKTTKAADAAGTAGKAAGAADTAKKAAKSLEGIAAGAAGGAAQKAVEGDGNSAMRRGAGRYAGTAASGAVAGAQAGAAAGGVGALPGAAIGAAKNVGLEGGKDAVEGASKVTGGGPDAEPADKRLGAGGTGYERRDKKDGELVSKTAKGVAVGGAAAAAPPAMGLVMLMALLKWLKTMFFAMLAMAANAANLVLGFIVGVAKAVGHAIAAPFVAIGGLVGKAAGAVFGVAVTATVAPVATAASGVVATITAVAVLSTVATGVLNQGGYDDGRGSSAANCFVNVGTGGPGADVPANTEANAQAVYSVLKSWGMPDENIAGILGNWSQESGVDPTSVESIYDEPYQIGPRKQAAWDGNFTHIPGQEHGGIGLGQWSNGRTPMLLDYAQSKGVDWYTIETQLAFMVEGDNPSDVAVFKDMITTSQGSPAAAAKYFHDKWERSADNAQMMQERVADAEMWYGKMSGWSVDDSVAGGVEDIVGDIVDTIGGGINTILGNCDSDTAGPGGLVDGGMNEEQAQQLVDLYNEEGDKFLDEKYGNSGGPGSCGDNHAMNCVSFSTYFMNKYTSFQQYAPGNGIRTAYLIAEMTGKQMQDNPVPYSVGSGPGSGPAGHTLVVLGVDGDKVIVGEAGYCSYMGRVRVDSAARLKAEGWKFVDVSDLIGEGGSDPDMLPAANNAP